MATSPLPHLFLRQFLSTFHAAPLSPTPYMIDVKVCIGMWGVLRHLLYGRSVKFRNYHQRSPCPPPPPLHVFKFINRKKVFKYRDNC